MKALALALLLLAPAAQSATLPQKCAPPGKPGTLMGMAGCLQPDGSLVTEKGFRIRVGGAGGGGGAGGDVEVAPPGGAGSEAARIDQLLEEESAALEQLAGQPDAGLERHALREAARLQRDFAQAVREVQQDMAPVSSPAGPQPAGAPAPAKPASPSLPNAADLEAWCSGILPVATRAEQEFRTPLPKASKDLPPIPPPPAADFWDCWGCERARADRYHKDARAWADQQWEGQYLKLELDAIRAAIKLARMADSPSFKQAAAQPNTACAALHAPGLGLAGGFDAPLFRAGIRRINTKLTGLWRQFGKPQQYPTLYPVSYAYLATLKMVSLLTCEEVDITQSTWFIQEQLAEIYKEWRRRLSVERDMRQLANVAFVLSTEKERLLLKAEATPEGLIEDILAAAIMDLQVDFQVKLAGQSAGAGGYVRARAKGKTAMYAYTDPEDERCGVLQSVEVENFFIRARPMALKVFDAEMYGPNLRNKYLGPGEVPSAVMIDLPCCRKNQPADVAYVYLEALGAQQSRGETESWRQPSYAPFPAIDNWFRVAFNMADLARMANSGQGEAEAAQMEKDMAIRQQQMDELQKRYERGEASVADLMAGAMKMKDELVGGGSLGKNSLLTQALHYRLEVPFRNNDKQPVKVKVDARERLKNGGPEAEGILENLAYGFGDVELNLRNPRNPPPARTPPKAP